jgi:hypothetical protein
MILAACNGFDPRQVLRAETGKALSTGTGGSLGVSTSLLSSSSVFCLRMDSESNSRELRFLSSPRTRRRCSLVGSACRA